MRQPFALTVLLLVSSACQAPSAAGSDPASADAVRAGSRAWLDAVQRGDWHAVAALYTNDAVVMPPGAPEVIGREAIEAFFRSFPQVVACTTEDLDVETRGDLAFVRGRYTMTMRIEGSDVTDAGKYLEVRKRQPDGRWLLFRDAFSSNASDQ